MTQLDVACSHWANAPEAIRRLFELFRQPRLMREIVNLNEWRPGHQSRPCLQTIAERSPAVAPQKKKHGGRNRIFSNITIAQTAREPTDRRTTEDTLMTSIAARPLFRGWHFRAPSAHARDAESDSFLACAARNPPHKGWRWRARDDACRRSRLLSSVFCHPGVV